MHRFLPSGHQLCEELCDLEGEPFVDVALLWGQAERNQPAVQVMCRWRSWSMTPPESRLDLKESALTASSSPGEKGQKA